MEKLLLFLPFVLSLSFVAVLLVLGDEDRKSGESDFRNYIARTYIILFLLDMCFSIIYMSNTDGWLMYSYIANMLFIFIMACWHEISLQRYYLEEEAEIT